MEMTNKFFKQRNCFGYATFSPLCIFTNEHEGLRNKIFKDAKDLLFKEKHSYLEIIQKTAEEKIGALDKGSSLEAVERAVEQELNFSYKKDPFVNATLLQRYNSISEQIIDALLNEGVSVLEGKDILDIGAGSGEISLHCKNVLKMDHIFLTDVVDYRSDLVKNLGEVKFELFQYPFLQIATDRKYDLCFLTNVLHHCDNPFSVFKTALRYLNNNGYIIIIESCINLNVGIISGAFSERKKIRSQMLYNADNTFQQTTTEFLTLTKKQMMIYGSFFDWLYNRVFLNENINVPYNFGSPDDWDFFFKSCGLTKLHTYLLGFDQPAALEFHSLHLYQLKSEEK